MRLGQFQPVLQLPAEIECQTSRPMFTLGKDRPLSSDDLRTNTMFLLMAQYNGAAVVPLDVVCRDFVSHLAVEKLCAGSSV